MTDFVPQAPGAVGITPTYNTATVSDTFSAVAGGRYMIHYKNGATPTGTLKIRDRNTPIPAGSTAVAGYADAQASASLGASAETVYWIQNASRYMDSTGKITLDNGTPTTLTFAIFGPMP
jgi:hypothetical protein